MYDPKISAWPVLFRIVDLSVLILMVLKCKMCFYCFFKEIQNCNIMLSFFE